MNMCSFYNRNCVSIVHKKECWGTYATYLYILSILKYYIYTQKYSRKWYCKIYLTKITLWSFKNPYNKLIWCSKCIISVLKTMLFNIFKRTTFIWKKSWIKKIYILLTPKGLSKNVIYYITPYVSELGDIWINTSKCRASVWQDKTAKMWSMHAWMSYKVLSTVHIPKQMWHWWHFQKWWQKCITMVQ